MHAPVQTLTIPLANGESLIITVDTEGADGRGTSRIGITSTGSPVLVQPSCGRTVHVSTVNAAAAEAAPGEGSGASVAGVQNITAEAEAALLLRLSRPLRSVAA